MDTTMKQATIAVEVVGEYESSFRLRLKTGYGDPVILVHKDEVKIDSVDKGRDLYEEVNAYMNPTAQRMSSREGLRKALAEYREVAA